MIHGRNLIVGIGDSPIAGARGCTVDRKTDIIEYCSPTDGAERSYMPGCTEWSINANGLYAKKTNIQRLRKVWRDRQAVSISYEIGGLKETGTAIVTSLQETGEVGALAKFSISLQGSGKLNFNGTINIGIYTDDDLENLRFDAQGALDAIYDSQGAQIYLGEFVPVADAKVYFESEDDYVVILEDISYGQARHAFSDADTEYLNQHYVSDMSGFSVKEGKRYVIAFNTPGENSAWLALS